MCSVCIANLPEVAVDEAASKNFLYMMLLKKPRLAKNTFVTFLSACICNKCRNNVRLTQVMRFGVRSRHFVDTAAWSLRIHQMTAY